LKIYAPQFSSKTKNLAQGRFLGGISVQWGEERALGNGPIREWFTFVMDTLMAPEVGLFKKKGGGLYFNRESAIDVKKAAAKVEMAITNPTANPKSTGSFLKLQNSNKICCNL
jgi:hypothetical protein